MKLLNGNEKGFGKAKLLQKKLFMIFTVFILMSSLVSAQDINNINLIEDKIQDTLEDAPLLSGFIKNSEICVIVHKDNEVYSFDVNYEGDDDVDVKYNYNFMCDGVEEEDFIVNFINYNYFDNLAEHVEEFSIRKIRSLVSLIIIGAKMDYYQILPSKFLELGGKIIWNAETQAKYSNIFKYASKFTKGKVSQRPRPYSERYHRNYVPEPEAPEQPVIDNGGEVIEEEEVIEVTEVEEVPEEETVTPPKPELSPFEEDEEETEEENLVIKDIHITDFEKTVGEKRPYSMRIDRRSVSK
ncbi:MAG: hypothetical protein KAT77_01590 [Nanoarchaeota archaeon]|nr:hypothetical protein [Nanoarchaeota archaeon]